MHNAHAPSNKQLHRNAHNHMLHTRSRAAQRIANAHSSRTIFPVTPNTPTTAHPALGLSHTTRTKTEKDRDEHEAAPVVSRRSTRTTPHHTTHTLRYIGSRSGTSATIATTVQYTRARAGLEGEGRGQSCAKGDDICAVVGLSKRIFILPYRQTD